MPDVETIMDLGMRYDGDYVTQDGRTVWKFVIMTFQGSTYVVENYPSDNPVVKKLH